MEKVGTIRSVSLYPFHSILFIVLPWKMYFSSFFNAVPCIPALIFIFPSYSRSRETCPFHFKKTLLPSTLSQSMTCHLILWLLLSVSVVFFSFTALLLSPGVYHGSPVGLVVSCYTLP